MIRLPTTEEVFGVLTLLFAAITLVALIRPGTFQFLLDKGTTFPSLQRQGQYVALVTMTWGFMWLVSKDKLTYEYATFYGLIFSGAQAVSIWLKMKGTDTSQSNGKPPEAKS